MFQYNRISYNRSIFLLFITQYPGHSALRQHLSPSGNHKSQWCTLIVYTGKFGTSLRKIAFVRHLRCMYKQIAKLHWLDTILPFISFVRSILASLMVNLLNVWKFFYSLQFKKTIKISKNYFYYVRKESNYFNRVIKVFASMIYLKNEGKTSCNLNESRN